MEYKIISGSTVEVRRSWLPCREGAERKKICTNENEAVKQLARILNCNIERGWMFVTCKFDDAHLPSDRDALKKHIARYVKSVRAAFKAEHGRNPRYVYVLGAWPVKHERPSRVHLHMVIEPCSADMLRCLWQGGGSVICEDIDNRQDHTALAVYMYKNAGRGERGECRWSTSRGNLAKPIYTEPVEVDSIEDVEKIPGSVMMDMVRLDDEDGRAISAYIRCVLPERPKVRGGQVILPKPPKRGGRKRAAA